MTAEPSKQITDDLGLLLRILPAEVAEALRREPQLPDLIEVVFDLGRVPQARFVGSTVDLGADPIDRATLAEMIRQIGAFNTDNRAGIERTLHRISAIRNRAGDIVGLTCRVGRAVYGTVEIVRDLIESGRSTLLLGPPGVGKTTLLREAARVLADETGKRVMIVDTSNEIGGDGDIPHPGIGRARRMQVSTPFAQHAVMIEAVENHMPEVVVIDEIGTAEEAAAARTIAERGVQLVATAHGYSLDNLLSNPTLADLLGGIQAVTLGDEEARRRSSQKTVLERKLPPTFDILIEIQTRDRFIVHHDVAKVVDEFLRGVPPAGEQRIRNEDGTVQTEILRPPTAELDPSSNRGPGGSPASRRPLRIFPYAVSEERLERAIARVGLRAFLVGSPRDADCILTLRTYTKRQPPKLREAMRRGLPVHYLRSNAQAQIDDFIAGLVRDRLQERSRPGHDEGSLEAENAARAVLERGESCELTPQPPAVRRQQHAIAEQFGIASLSQGREPYRRVVLYPVPGPR